MMKTVTFRVILDKIALYLIASMSSLKLILSIIFITTLPIVMMIPIGTKTINGTFVIGFRLDYIIHCLIYLPWMFVGKVFFSTR